MIGFNNVHAQRMGTGFATNEQKTAPNLRNGRQFTRSAIKSPQGNISQVISNLLQQLQNAGQSTNRPTECCGKSPHQPDRDRNEARQAIHSAQAFNTPAGATEPGPALSGGAYEFTVDAQPGQNLSFATMLAATNDQFIAPKHNQGISLFDKQGQPLEGDITHLLAVWDAGTEANEPVGSGPNQPANQAGPNTGPDDPNSRIRRSTEGVGSADQLVKAMLSYNDNGQFTVTLQNISGENGNEIPLAPGVATTHGAKAQPLFSIGHADRGQGLESLAEDGDPTALLAHLQSLIK